MNNLHYCLDCKRVFEDSEKCTYCQSDDIKELTNKAPVNILGSKLKGKVIDVKKDNIRVLIRDENNSRFIKEYTSSQLKKVL